MSKPKFGSNLLSVNEKLRSLQPEEPKLALESPTDATPIIIAEKSDKDQDPWVSFTVHIKRSTYMQIKQAEFWVSGFGEMREHADVAWQEYLLKLPESQKALPEKVLDKLLKTSKKLQ
ncbi:hypothetical protein [Hymenobacter norwichensis]|uniref:hypothetical protein n=1 Tax=Hymenobacter norwichensis TaxID=223903 RepID=UPI000524B7D4|nr:hypothetical protein [Hymenobacter norwichensis]